MLAINIVFITLASVKRIMSSPSKHRILRTLKRLPPESENPKWAPKGPPPNPTDTPSPAPSPFDTPRQILRDLPPPPTPPKVPPTSPSKKLWKQPLLPVAPASTPKQPVAAEVAAKTDKVTSVMDRIADALGGYDKLDLSIASYSPALYAFAAESPLARVPFVNRPAKLIFLLTSMGMLQAVIPILSYPVNIVSHFLGLAFLVFISLRCLQLGLGFGAQLPRAILLTCFLTTSIDLIPVELVDVNKHLGVLRALVLPIALLTSPAEKPTLALSLADTIAPYIAKGLSLVHPSNHLGLDWQTKTLIALSAIGLLFWVGYLGERGSDLIIWSGLAFETLRFLASPKPNIPPATLEDLPPLADEHNLLAMWTWRLLVSAVMSAEVPGVLSLRGIVSYYLPSFYLMITSFFVAMLVADKTHTMTHADSWYAKCLLNLGTYLS